MAERRAGPVRRIRVEIVADQAAYDAALRGRKVGRDGLTVVVRADPFGLDPDDCLERAKAAVRAAVFRRLGVACG